MNGRGTDRVETGPGTLLKGPGLPSAFVSTGGVVARAVDGSGHGARVGVSHALLSETVSNLVGPD